MAHGTSFQYDRTRFRWAEKKAAYELLPAHPQWATLCLAPLNLLVNEANEPRQVLCLCKALLQITELRASLVFLEHSWTGARLYQDVSVSMKETKRTDFIPLQSKFAGLMQISCKLTVQELMPQGVKDPRKCQCPQSNPLGRCWLGV